MARGPASCHWPRMVFSGLQPRIPQNIFRWPQVFPGFPMGFSRFPRKKKIKWIEVQTPHDCIHLEKFMYPLALVSGAPTKHTFSGSIPLPIIHFQHLALIHASFWGVTPPLVPIHFWQKVRGVTPPLCSYIIRNVGSTPLLLNQLGSGMSVCKNLCV